MTRSLQKNLSAFLFVISAACAALTLASLEDATEAALQSDDQCISNDCALNALQRKTQTATVIDGDEDDEDKEAEEWAHDISVAVKNGFKHKLTKLQPFIMERYKNLTELEVKVNATMLEVEKATGEKVIWNRKSGDADDDGAELLAVQTRHGRRRHHANQKLPPRANYVMKIIKYLDKEMVSVWDLYTIVDRKRFGILNTVISHPDGPGGRADPVELGQEDQKEHEAEQHHSRRRHNHAKAEEEDDKGDIVEAEGTDKTITNKYEKELEDDYLDIVNQINDAHNKTEMLRVTLAQTAAKAEAWIATR